MQMSKKKRRVKNYQKKHRRKRRLNKQRGGYGYGISPWYAHEDDNKQQGGYYRKRKTRQKGGFLGSLFLGPYVPKNKRLY